MKLRERLSKSRKRLLEVRKQGTETNYREQEAGLERDWNDREDGGRRTEEMSIWGKKRNKNMLKKKQ